MAASANWIFVNSKNPNQTPNIAPFPSDKIGTLNLHHHKNGITEYTEPGMAFHASNYCGISTYNQNFYLPACKRIYLIVNDSLGLCPHK